VSERKRLGPVTRFIIRFDIILYAIAAPAFAWYAITKDWTVAFVSLLAAAMFVAALMAALMTDRKFCRPVRPPPRPSVDWHEVARMETDVWGRTFHHDGAPDLDLLLQRDDAMRAGSERLSAAVSGRFSSAGDASEALDAMLADIRRATAATRRICDSGHVEVPERPGCIICEHRERDSR
jgi:hypothetical protein